MHDQDTRTRSDACDSVKREQLASIREEVEDLFDYLDVLEARARDRGKPKWSHAEVKQRYGLK
ncbi:MAG: hypothetical protein KGS61_06080 [Verrucomicrobia bacterium]|nr:hypothetical protein [Verrucomicrobiota bacterium]